MNGNVRLSSLHGQLGEKLGGHHRVRLQAVGEGELADPAHRSRSNQDGCPRSFREGRGGGGDGRGLGRLRDPFRLSFVGLQEEGGYVPLSQ